MKNLKGRCIFAQSGGPTAVINASLAGCVTEALSRPEITGVLVAKHGVKGVIAEDLYDMSKESQTELQALKHTPAMAFGSVRYKLKRYTEDDTDYKKLLAVFKKYDVRYFFYNGGNDSMDTCAKISEYMSASGYDVNVIGIPKTIDNDLVGTDHCPGYASAAKYIATSTAEVALDAGIYESPLVIILEIMGRNAGWLAAAASISTDTGYGADLVYLPEVPFDNDKFISDVKNVLSKKVCCVVAVSEGIKRENGKYVGEDDADKDVFGHTKLGGVCGYLKNVVTQKIGAKCKAIEFNILQRSAAHIASETDANEAFEVGRQAVLHAVSGETGKMISIVRTGNYSVRYDAADLSVCANAEKQVPREWINEDGNGLTEEFKNYLRPLIIGENPVRYENGLPSYAKLKKIKFEI